MKKWIKDHLILILIISSILFAFIIHCLFSESAPNEWFVAKWGAGDVLTYVSTIALGLLTVWQNKKLKKEVMYRKEEWKILQSKQMNYQ